MVRNDWTLVKLPPKDDPDVGKFFYDLFEIARQDKERLQVNLIALQNYADWRGRGRGGVKLRGRQKTTNPANLLFANVERTVSNITARDPVGEVVDLDGETDDAEKILTAKLIKWRKDTNHRMKLRNSGRIMEIYGITIEKPFHDATRLNDVDIELVDMFGLFPAPGMWADMSTDCPYLAFCYVDFKDAIEAKFKVTGVNAEEAYHLLGREREEYRTHGGGAGDTTGRYATPMLPVEAANKHAPDRKLEHGLIVEVWVRDKSTTSEKVLTQNPEWTEESPTDIPRFIEGTEERLVYPDGVRKVTVTMADGRASKGDSHGVIVLDDSANPNINPVLPVKQARYTHPWGRFPIYTANSYRDPNSIWGFAAIEQTRVMLNYINIILRKLTSWTKDALTPTLILQKHCGITKKMIKADIDKGGRLVLMPTIPDARIEYLVVPNLPASFFQVLDKIIQLHDRIYAIEEADRGVAPKGVIAAQAIVALQEKNQVALQPKTTSIESLAENRSKWAIGLWQNWGTDADMVNVAGQPKEFIGVNYAGRRFNFVVESGSTAPRTSLQNQELIMKLAEAGKVSIPYMLEQLNLPNWKEEVARTAGPMMGQALSVLKDAGLPPNVLQDLMGMLQEIQAQQQNMEPSIRNQAEEGQDGGNNAAV